MSPPAPERTNRASTTPRSDGVVRLLGRGGEGATATGRTPRDRCRPAGGFQMPAPGGKRSSTPPGAPRNRSGAGGVPSSRHRHGRVSMQLRRAAVGMALVAMVAPGGCDWGRGRDGGGRAAADNAATEAQVAPAADREARAQAAAPGKAGSTDAAAQVGLGGPGNRGA